jgi:hypothetical protein
MLRRGALVSIVSAAALVIATGAAAAIGLTVSSFTFAPTISGADQSVPFSFSMSATGTSGPFNITMSATPFQAGSYSLGFPTLTNVSTGACTGGGCVNAANTIGYPIAVDASTQKIYSTPTAKQTIPLTADLTLALPGNAYAGSYTSTFAVTIATGP